MKFLSDKRIIISFVLIIYLLIIILPPIIHGYVYPNNSDDTAVHLAYFKALQQGQDIGYSYLGRQIVGYPMIWFNQLFGWSINIQFMWFNFITLWLVGVSVFILISKVINYKAGLIAIFIIMFTSPIVLNLYDTGGIFDLMTVGIILPLALLCLTYSIVNRKLKWIIPMLILGGLAVGVHSLQLFSMNPLIKQPTTPVNEFLFVLLGYPITIILVLSVSYLIYKNVKLEQKEKILLWGFLAIIIVFIPLSFTQITAWSTRFATDLAIIVVIFTAYLLGLCVKKIKVKPYLVVIIFFILGVSSPVISHYYQYNSAIKPIDLKVIEYLNTLPEKYFSCSPEVSPWIYESYTNKTYNRDVELYIKRNKPMTSATNPDSVDYWFKGVQVPNVSLDNAKYFKEDDIEIWVRK